jgi:hypothetical protein
MDYAIAGMTSNGHAFGIMAFDGEDHARSPALYVHDQPRAPAGAAAEWDFCCAI